MTGQPMMQEARAHTRWHRSTAASTTPTCTWENKARRAVRQLFLADSLGQSIRWYDRATVTL